MNSTAQPTVSLLRNDAGPRLPNAVCVLDPPKAPAKSALLPDCSNTTKINIKQTIMCNKASNVIMEISRRSKD